MRFSIKDGLTPKWTPSYQNGVAVKSKKKQPITFVVTEE